jgi:hypothetical protein
MENHAMKAVHEALAKIQEIDIRSNPKSVLAAIIYSITQLPDEKKPLEGLILLLCFFFGKFLRIQLFLDFLFFYVSC